MAPHKTLKFIPKRFSRSTCDFDSGGSIEKIWQAQCEWFDILTFSYIFQRLEKRGRGRGSIIEAAASVISSIKDNEELASK